jgi:hypothetical protein
MHLLLKKANGSKISSLKKKNTILGVTDVTMFFFVIVVLLFTLTGARNYPNQYLGKKKEER